ncbi:OspG family effector kinase [Pseudomonas tolaasii]|nr:hypothetical protein [Pseudomonas tolaasii]PKA76114.1 hypothetical protein ATI14_3064 [Pseudomonas tolaasii NCPPB 2192]
MTVVMPPSASVRSVSSINPATQNPPVIANQVHSSAPQRMQAGLNNPAALKTAFGDSCDWKTLAKKLQAITVALNQQFPDAGQARGEALAAELATRLKHTTIPVCEDSTYYRQHALTPASVVSLEQYLKGSHLKVPGSRAELIELSALITQRSQVHPLGNFSGALSWPVPLGTQGRRTIAELLQSDRSGLPGLPLADARKGALGYLLSGSAVSDEDLKTPTIAIEKLLGTLKAQTLGLAIQTELGGFATDSSLNEYLLAAVQLGLDPESCDTPARNSVAGFDLGHRQHTGQRPSTIIDNLSRHLLEKGRVTAQTATLGARLLLARSAPAFLVKDIPASVTYGSLTWTQLAMATARIEADSPGRALNLSYAEVLAFAEQVDTSESSLQSIQQNALADWGWANGLLATHTPRTSEIDTVRVEYNRQMEALRAASSLAQTSIPDRRKMALDVLKAAFPALDPKLFEAPSLVKVFRIEGGGGRFPGMRSMLDIVMNGGVLGANEHWFSRDGRIPVARFCALYEAGKLDVAKPFKADYDQAITLIEKGHQGLAQYLISTLAPQDRKNLEYGQLEFFHTNEYTMAGDLFSKPSLRTRGHTLRVKTTLNGEVNIYEVDTRNARVEKQNYWINRYTPPYTDTKLHQREANVISKTVLFDPFKVELDQAREKPVPAVAVPRFGSSRSDYIGRVFASSLDLHNADLLQQARGITSFDEDTATSQAVGEFFLNLIPLRSAIVNFSNGNVADGLLDLSLDFIGLVTLGAGKAVQAGKAFSKGLSTSRGLAKATRFVGAAAIEAFNPLSGAGDLAVGVGGLVKKGSRLLISKGATGVHRLRGASRSYDLLKAASRQHGAAAIGTFRLAGDTVEGGAVLHKGQWYALDVKKLRPYGSPLEAFAPDTHAITGVIQAKSIPRGAELDNTLHTAFKVPESTISGLPRNSQGVYTAANGHSSYIRHTDHLGHRSVYEVRQISRTEDGIVQARVYHNNRQTELLMQRVQGDQWQRLGAKGGYPHRVNSDCGRQVGSGAEAVVYESLDGSSVYKCFDTEVESFDINAVIIQADALNLYYGEGFAEAFTSMGDAYIKMKKLDGVSLASLQPTGLPVQTRSLLDDAIKSMEEKNIFQGDLHLGNFLYSARDKKIYPIDISPKTRSDLTIGDPVPEDVMDDYDLYKASLYNDFNRLLIAP